MGKNDCREGVRKSQPGRGNLEVGRLGLAWNRTGFLRPCARARISSDGPDRAQVNGRNWRQYDLAPEIEIRGYLSRRRPTATPRKGSAERAPDDDCPVRRNCRQTISRRSSSTVPRPPSAERPARPRGARSSRPFPRRSGSRSGPGFRTGTRHHRISRPSGSRDPAATG